MKKNLCILLVLFGLGVFPALASDWDNGRSTELFTKAKKDDQLLLVYFAGDPAMPNADTKAVSQALASPEVSKLTEKFFKVKFTGFRTSGTRILKNEDQPVTIAYKKIPTLVILDCTGKELGRLEGMPEEGAVLAFIKGAAEKVAGRLSPADEAELEETVESAQKALKKGRLSEATRKAKEVKDFAKEHEGFEENNLYKMAQAVLDGIARRFELEVKEVEDLITWNTLLKAKSKATRLARSYNATDHKNEAKELAERVKKEIEGRLYYDKVAKGINEETPKKEKRKKLSKVVENYPGTLAGDRAADEGGKASKDKKGDKKNKSKDKNKNRNIPNDPDDLRNAESDEKRGK